MSIEQKVGDVPSANPLSKAEVEAWIAEAQEQNAQQAAAQQQQSSDMWSQVGDLLGKTAEVATDVVCTVADIVTATGGFAVDAVTTVGSCVVDTADIACEIGGALIEGIGNCLD